MSTKVVEIKTLKVGKYIVLGGEACKIISYTTSSPGKHGAAKARIEAVGVFDNQKRSLVKPVDNKVDIPIIDKRLGQVISIQGDNVQIMDMENYDTIDLPMPEDLKDVIVEGIEVEYIVALGNMKIMRTYEPWKFAFSKQTNFENLEEDSFGIIGVPFDSTTSYHSGSRLGPIVVREASFGFEKYNTVFNKDLTTSFYDFGDVNVIPGNCESTCKIVEDTVNELLDLKIKPIIIGGEHSASIGAIKAICEKYDKLTVIHLDAHRDLAFDFIGEKYSHATVMRRAHECGANLVQIGIRSSSAEEEEFVKSIYNVIFSYKKFQSA